MDSREKLYFLLNEYLKGGYTTETFANTFTDVYNVETNYDLLTEQENKYFQSLCEITERFSPFEKDLQKYDCYYNEEQVRKKALEVKKALEKNNNIKPIH